MKNLKWYDWAVLLLACALLYIAYLEIKDCEDKGGAFIQYQCLDVKVIK